ncbi:MAG: oxidoreductase [Bacteroidetes bacterium]|nr:MAG: oxidoreductase [Bacteroidota bacterium]MBL1144933.1 acryloyl-CoA reductase [Bacteroidota bacterium]NOG57727.1 YhdH/YhfP family quinone oxidoreductase [Bacteroidota bacterium]
MEQIDYKAFVVREENGTFHRKIEQKSTTELPDHDVLIQVKYAALNYKDALSSNGHKGITRNYPHTPGVDACGIVVSSKTDDFEPGEKVIVTSYDFGMNTSGGFQEYIKVPATWPVKLPKGMSLEEAMILGTGGFTAALSLYKMEQNGQCPEMGPVLVTGSTGGVGSMAVCILAEQGYDVIAASGKKEAHAYLHELGAKEIISREEVNDQSGRPLLRSKWAGAIDTVGDNTLATCIKACGRNGSIAVCGLVQSADLNTSVYPFILNGVNVLGIETAETPRKIRNAIWELLANQWKPKKLDAMKKIISLDELDEHIQVMLQGKSKGRVLVKF